MKELSQHPRAIHSREWRAAHPENYTADARRISRKISDEMYRATTNYQKAREKYKNSGKKRITNANGHLKHKYGRTLADKQAQYEKQQGLCGLCGSPLPEDVMQCHWDHDHKTGQMRDLLHKYCNQLLGWIENDLAPKAFEYIERYANVRS